MSDVYDDETLCAKCGCARWMHADEQLLCDYVQPLEPFSESLAECVRSGGYTEGAVPLYADSA